MACLIRVPVDVVKQRTQAQPHLTTFKVFTDVLRSDVNEELIVVSSNNYFNTYIKKY